jgi:iron complex outermembrane receptor protein
MNKNGKPKQAVLFIMRVTLLQCLLVLSCISYSFAGKADGQEILDKKVSLNLPSREIRAILRTISASTEIGFTYSSDLLYNRQKITVIANQERLGDVLEKIFKPLHISFEVIGRQIVLKNKEALMEITGTVRGSDGQPLQGVRVTVAGTTRGTTTNEKGVFRIEANPGETLIFSSIGYVDNRATIGDSSPINMVLTKTENSMGEVVVTALGIKREARSLGYSDQRVSGADLIKSDPPNISNGLIGKAAGLNITLPNGVEGGSSRIVIRGNNSLFGNNQPLIVIDGVMVDNEQMLPNGQNLSTTALLNPSGSTARDVSQTGADYGSFLNTVNADDVESVNVLKGPTAAALYGARGANGVILIVTKKGTKQKGLGLNYSFSDRWNDPYRYIKLQHEYGSGMTETLWSATPAFNQDGSGNNRQFTENDQYGAHQNIPNPGGGASAMPFYNVIGFPGDGASWGPKMQGQPLVWWDGSIYDAKRRRLYHGLSFAGRLQTAGKGAFRQSAGWLL